MNNAHHERRTGNIRAGRHGGVNALDTSTENPERQALGGSSNVLYEANVVVLRV